MTTSVDSSEPIIEAAARDHEIAVLVPCFNEELTVGKTVAAFREALPLATVYVYDNNSTDRTVEVARAAGAVVRAEPRQGKGYVVRRMFADIDADVFVLVEATRPMRPKPPLAWSAGRSTKIWTSSMARESPRAWKPTEQATGSAITC
jgi:hypothetical protein